MLKLYGMADSGNCYKPCLLLAHLDRPYEWIPVDIRCGESRTPEFLRMNPNGRVPVLELEPAEYLAESNAILCYLAEGSQLLPSDPLERARVLQWMFFEQYSHEPYIATSRYWLYLLRARDKYRAELERCRRPGLAALDVMERHLGERAYFVGERLSIADIALYAYTHVAGEGEFELDGYPGILAWLERVASHPRHVPMRRLESAGS